MYTALFIQNVTLGYREGKKTIPVANVAQASLERGELVALIGRNGAGKSTLLRTLAAYIKPLEGHVLYEGREVQTLSAQELAKRYLLYSPTPARLRT